MRRIRVERPCILTLRAKFRFTDARTLKAEASGQPVPGSDSEEESSDEEEQAGAPRQNRRTLPGSDDDSSSEEDAPPKQPSSTGKNVRILGDAASVRQEAESANARAASESSGSMFAPKQGNSAPVNKFALDAQQKTQGDVEAQRAARRAAKKGGAAGKSNGKAAAGPSNADNDSDSDKSDDSVLQAGGAANRNLNKAMKASSLADGPPKKAAVAQGMNRKEREAQAAKEARERYLAATRAGKTDEAKSDLARLAAIRKQREEAAARRTAEQADAETAKQKAIEASGRKR